MFTFSVYCKIKNKMPTTNKDTVFNKNYSIRLWLYHGQVQGLSLKAKSKASDIKSKASDIKVKTRTLRRLEAKASSRGQQHS